MDLIRTPLAATKQNARDLIEDNRLDSFVGMHMTISRRLNPQRESFSDGSSRGALPGRRDVVFGVSIHVRF